jgi:hypothetical protein
MDESQTLDEIRLFSCENPLHDPGMIYRYARVSSDEQSFDAQVAQLGRPEPNALSGKRWAARLRIGRNCVAC